MVLHVGAVATQVLQRLFKKVCIKLVQGLACVDLAFNVQRLGRTCCSKRVTTAWTTPASFCWSTMMGWLWFNFLG